MSASKGQGEAVKFHQLMEERESLRPLQAFLPKRPPAAFSITALRHVKDALRVIEDEGIEVQISTEVAALQEAQLPQDFDVTGF